ncbi:MAG: outer membrane protein assembly factor, partial [Burkholderiaceae bacterium]|nr:outer membrane protein assembly factor [Burkholderiaceae bacterium]
PAAGASWSDRFVDAEDGKFDMSEHLLQHRGFLPVPIIVTEPAVGYGLGAGLLFFSESFAEAREKSTARGERFAPPNIGALAAFKTENGSWGAGGGYFGSVAGDRYRYLVGLAKVSLNLDYYGFTDEPRRFTMEAPAGVVQGLARLGDSDWFAGARYIYAGTSVRFARERPPVIGPGELESDIGRASLLVDYDSRDNILTPSRGAYIELDAGVARPGLGSSTSFENVNARGFSYTPIGAATVLGLRADGKFTRGEVPFYARPFVMLRGVPAMRYQGERTLVAEAELRHNVTPRWAVVGFGGAGKAYGGRTSFADARTVGAGGVGFRYLIARKLGLYAGLDVARGPEETAIYIQVGSAWN